MKQRKPIQISIPNPCHEDWNKMTPAEQGRFCSHCQKVVTDFTNYTDAQLYQFFSDRNKQVCGRFYNHQLNATISIPAQPHSRLYRYFIGLGLTLLFTQLPESNLRAQAPYVHAAMDKAGMNDQQAAENSFQISGHVINEHKEPMIGAIVGLYKNSVQIAQAITDEDGFFKINISDSLASAFPFELRTRYSSYLTQSMMMPFIKSTQDISIKMNPYVSSGLTEIIVIPYKVPLIDPFEPNKTVISSDEIEQRVH